MCVKPAAVPLTSSASEACLISLSVARSIHIDPAAVHTIASNKCYSARPDSRVLCCLALWPGRSTVRQGYTPIPISQKPKEIHVTQSLTPNW